MQMVPIPTRLDYLAKTAPHWLPFISRIAHRSKETVPSLLGMIKRLEVQLIMAWDEHADKAVALMGVRRWMRSDGMIGELIWMTGTRRNEWQPLLPELERFLKETGCVEIRPICRPGWSRILADKGYRTTHVIMEKRL